MDLNSKAQAIWATLDEMAARNPEEYKKFIQQQMEGAEELFRETKIASKVLGRENTTLLQTQLSGNTRVNQHSENRGEKTIPNSTDKLTDQLGHLQIQLDPSGKKSGVHENKLTDEVFTLKSSMLSAIVKPDDALGEDDPAPFVDLALPLSSGVLERNANNEDDKGKRIANRGPLIEEL